MTYPFLDYAPPQINIVVGKYYETRDGDVFECLFELDNPINDEPFGGIITLADTGRQFSHTYRVGGVDFYQPSLTLVKEINMSWPARIARAFRDWFQKEDNSPLTPALIIGIGIFAFKMMGGV